ncbi:MAG: filamentous hemagglutinin N-terminal domain-containing protein, partial [Phycisphaeraceae bacterium]|nr:filamentous hemagglutinin N-terminal domain-containing protein [Phycisphaeraceae bacterium]
MRLLFRMWQDLHRRNRLACIVACIMCLSMAPPTVLARRYPYGVQGAHVVHGSVSFGYFGNTTTITASDRSVIDYISFDIARSDIVRFIQPSPGASVLNRITSARPTNIDGTLLANGRVFFVNPAGVYIGVDAQINVNQLVASGLNISNADYINDQMNFTGGDGTVTNQGDIIATGVILLGKHVINAGNISCPEGHIIMAAGERMFVRELGSGVIIQIDPSTGSEPQDSLPLMESEPGVLNQGNIEAAGGRITLGAGDFYAKAVSNIGSLSASVTTGKAGRIDMTANVGQISNTGSIKARSDSGTGGSIAAAAAEVINSGTIDV